MESMMQPTWQTDDGRVKLWLADCLDVLPTLEAGSVDAVVTDPPYGIDYENAGGFSEQCGWKRHEKLGWDFERPTKAYFDMARSVSRVQVFWGGNYFADLLPPSMRWLIWDKGQEGFTLADCEMAWTNQKKATRRLTIPRGIANREPRLHWTQKPVRLMEWTIQTCCDESDTICDTHIGSGTTGVACVRLGRKFLGVEKEKKYFDIAKRRIIAELERMPLFEDKPTYRQAELV